jgi:hypothetical protein
MFTHPAPEPRHPPRFAGYLLPNQRVAVPTDVPRVWLVLDPGSGHLQVASGDLPDGAAPLRPVPEVPEPLAVDAAVRADARQLLAALGRQNATGPEVRAAAAALDRALRTAAAEAPAP